jgi:hypothetical protein
MHTGTRKAHTAKYSFKVANPNVGWRVLNISPLSTRRNPSNHVSADNEDYVITTQSSVICDLLRRCSHD